MWRTSEEAFGHWKDSKVFLGGINSNKLLFIYMLLGFNVGYNCQHWVHIKPEPMCWWLWKQSSQNCCGFLTTLNNLFGKRSIKWKVTFIECVHRREEDARAHWTLLDYREEEEEPRRYARFLQVQTAAARAPRMNSEEGWCARPRPAT